MIDYKQVQNYIETKNNIKLKPFQILALKAIIREKQYFYQKGLAIQLFIKVMRNF